MTEESGTGDNRRRNFRTNAPFKVFVRLSEWEALEEARLKGDGFLLSRSGAFGEISSEDNPAFEPLMDLILRMDDKLNRILRKLGSNKSDEHEIEIEKTIDISGSGLSFLALERLEIGQLLHLSIEIPGFSAGRFESHGEVKKCLNMGDGGKGPYDTGVEFLYLSEALREGLISYTFSTQRKLIRDTAKG